MESCFPPLAALSLRSSGRNNNSKSQKNNRHSTNSPTKTTPPSSPNYYSSQLDTSYNLNDNNDKAIQNEEFTPKLEVLQDLDLYYIRQIASSLKVSIIIYCECMNV